MVFLIITGILCYFIVPIYIYLNWIEKINYKYKNIELEPHGAWIIFFLEIAFLAQVIYWVK